MNRDSFGFNSITRTGKRISAGSEQNIDIQILNSSLFKLTENTKNVGTGDIDNATKIRCFNDLIADLNNYFLNLLSHDVASLSKHDLIELMSYLLLAQMLIHEPLYKNIAVKLEGKNIINICDKFLKLDKEEYYKLIKTHLDGSKKALTFITDLKIKLQE